MPEIAGVSAGGMPNRVKCLHVLVGARAGRRPRREPARRRGAGRAAATGGRPARASPSPRRGRMSAGRRHRLRHQLDPAAGRRRCRRRLPAAPIDVHREMRIVRLGEGVDRTGRLAPEALERTRRRAGRLRRARSRRTAPTRVRMVATSATRDAANRDEFVGHGARTAGRRARGDHRRRGGRAVVRRRGWPALPGAAPTRCWSPTSAAARPSWCSAVDRRRACGRATAWTSAASG